MIAAPIAMPTVVAMLTPSEVGVGVGVGELHVFVHQS
jgi:hypothetical protein